MYINKCHICDKHIIQLRVEKNENMQQAVVNSYHIYFEAMHGQIIMSLF